MVATAGEAGEAAVAGVAAPEGEGNGMEVAVK